MNLGHPRPSVAESQILLAVGPHSIQFLRRNRHQACLALMTPAQNHAPMQLPFDASARRFAALAGKLIDIPFHQRGPLESDLQRRLQFFQGILQSRPKTAELFRVLPCLHAIDIYRIQTAGPQSKKSIASLKMFRDDRVRLVLAGLQRNLTLVSEPQSLNTCCPTIQHSEECHDAPQPHPSNSTCIRPDTECATVKKEAKRRNQSTIVSPIYSKLRE